MNQQQNLPLSCDRSVTPRRAAQILSTALGHRVSRQTVVRLIARNELRGHKLFEGGNWWINTDSILEYAKSRLEGKTKHCEDCADRGTSVCENCPY